MSKPETLGDKLHKVKKKPTKKHTRTPLEIRDDPNTRYYEGTLTKITPGRGDTIQLHMTNVKGVRMMYGTLINKPCKQDEMTFIVPKKRERTFNFAKRRKPNEILLVMLRKDSHGKYTVQEIQYQGVGSLQ